MNLCNGKEVPRLVGAKRQSYLAVSMIQVNESENEIVSLTNERREQEPEKTSDGLDELDRRILATMDWESPNPD